MEKMYWKVRKIKNDLVFKIKAFLHTRRDKLEVKKENISFKQSVMKEVFKAFMKNIFIIAFILIIDRILVSKEIQCFAGNATQKLQNWVMSIDENVMKDSGIFAGVLSAIIGVSGVFLGLYCANIMSMYAEKYANAPQKISRLFESDIVTNRCIQTITNYLIFSIMILFLLVMQIDIGITMIIVSGFKGLEIIVSFGFMSRRTYQFSDMYYVTNVVYKDMYKILLHLNKGKWFINDNNFQNHYKKQAKKCLEVLTEVNDYNLEKEEKISVSVENFMKNNVALLYSYWSEKSKIPYDSYWFDDKVIYKKWYNADDSEITVALRTGTLLGHDVVKNYLWLEEEIEKINDNCLQYLIDKKSFAGVIRWLGTLADLSKRAVESGNVGYYVDYLYKIQKKLQKTIVEQNFSLEEEMALAEHIVVSYLAVLIDIRKYLENQGGEVCLCDIRSFEGKRWKFSSRYHNYADVRKIHDGIRTEIKLEGKRITPEWYINQVIAKHYYEDILHMYYQINLAVNQYIPELAETLLEQKKNAGAMVVFAKYSEVRSKAKMAEGVLDKNLSWLLEFQKEKSIIWKDKPDVNITRKFDEIYKGMSSKWCQCTSIFALEHWDTYEQYPDILGACATYLCEILIDAIIENEFDTFSSNYKNLLGVLLLYQEYSRKELIQIKEVYRQSAVLAVYTNPIIEYSMISGYAYLWGEISGDSRWKELILENTEKNVTKNDVGKKFCELLTTIRNRMPAFYYRDILHTQWCQKVETVLSSNENIRWKSDRFYEVYDGESKLLRSVLSVRNEHDFLKCEAFEIYAVVVLNRFLQEDSKYRSRDGWEDKYYE